MKTVEIEVYDFYELSDEAKKKARENVMNSHDFRSYLECVRDADWRDIDMDFMDKCLYAYDHDKVAWRGISKRRGHIMQSSILCRKGAR